MIAAHHAASAVLALTLSIVATACSGRERPTDRVAPVPGEHALGEGSRTPSLAAAGATSAAAPAEPAVAGAPTTSIALVDAFPTEVEMPVVPASDAHDAMLPPGVLPDDFAIVVRARLGAAPFVELRPRAGMPGRWELVAADAETPDDPSVDLTESLVWSVEVPVRRVAGLYAFVRAHDDTLGCGARAGVATRYSRPRWSRGVRRRRSRARAPCATRSARCRPRTLTRTGWRPRAAQSATAGRRRKNQRRVEPRVIAGDERTGACAGSRESTASQDDLGARPCAPDERSETMTATTGIPAPTYEPTATLHAGRALYFERYGFGDGGYDAKWVELNKVAGIPIGFPNSPGRVRAVKLHDLHHVLTGYPADYTGEAEIGAWELAAGCGRHVAAWILNAGAFVYGVFISPGRVLRAFARGRRSRTLYYLRELDESLLTRTVAEQRRDLGLDAPPAEPTLADRLVFVTAWLAALALVLSPFALISSVVTALL